MKKMLFCALATVFALGQVLAQGPLVEFLFNQGSGTSIPNPGSQGGTATRTTPTPKWSAQTPDNGGSYSLDFGNTIGNFGVDLPATNSLNNLKSFTITGWLNCRSATTGNGGNRIMSWRNPSADGVDLAFHSDGRIQVGINQWNDLGGVASNAEKITVDPNATYNNWRFFAITYDATLSSNQIKFYFGAIGAPAELDVARTYNVTAGKVGSNVNSTFTIGNHAPGMRTSTNFNWMFRGLIDEVRIYGSTSDGSGAKNVNEIQFIQNATPVTNLGGILMERWNGISGIQVSDLTSASSFPASPSVVQLLPSFDLNLSSPTNFGARLSGWVKAPETGKYLFYITADDRGQLFLSSDANPANKQLIASSPSTHANGYQNWAGAGVSDSITLQAGAFYYIEALVKNGPDIGHISVGWKRPSEAGMTPQERPIPAGRLFLRPSGADAQFQSAIHIYEPGTSNIKATIGWHKQAGNDHLFIETMGLKRARIYGDTMFVDGIAVKAGNMVASDMVTTKKWRIPDYVFEPGYKLRSLEETEAYLKTHKHLPEIPSAAEIEKNGGMSVSEMNVKLLKTVEELTLHVIEMKKQVKAQKARNDRLEKEMRAIKGAVRK